MRQAVESNSVDLDVVYGESNTDGMGHQIAPETGPHSPTKTKGTNGHNGQNGDIHIEEEDLKCGFGSCTPDWLQVFNNPKAFLVWLSWFSFLQGKLMPVFCNSIHIFHLFSSFAIL